jgi:TadE-like protein
VRARVQGSAEKFDLTRMSRLRKIVTETVGSEIAEAALVIPIFFMILLGIYWFGRAFNSYATINHAAREGALAASMATCASCGNQQASQSNVAGVVTAALKASGLDPGQILPYAPSTTASCGGIATSCTSTVNNVGLCTNAQLTPVAAPGSPVCGVIVSFQYPYSFSLPFGLPPYGANAFNLQLKADVQMKGQY